MATIWHKSHDSWINSGTVRFRRGGIFDDKSSDSKQTTQCLWPFRPLQSKMSNRMGQPCKSKKVLYVMEVTSLPVEGGFHTVWFLTCFQNVHTVTAKGKNNFPRQSRYHTVVLNVNGDFYNQPWTFSACFFSINSHWIVWHFISVSRESRDTWSDSVRWTMAV